MILARIASGQRGSATRKQLLAAGVSARELERRIRKGLLISRYPGVYQVGHVAQGEEAELMAAVLACGAGSRARGYSASFLHRLIKRAPRIPEVLTPTERRIAGIRTVRARVGIDPVDVTVVRAISTTTVPRTIVDLAADLEPDELALLCHEARVIHPTAPRHFEAVLARRPNSPGAAKLREIAAGKTKVALSGLERRFLELLEAEGLPLPATNTRAGSHLVDCRWPELKVTIELDSYTYHSSRHAWEADRRREREAYARGDQFRRYTRDDVFERPEVALGEVRRLVGRD
ncbi:MAG: type IV toxin-antitoxin system AbiEi family antitoxin domain-containing protein [Solirubrobacterales bacterium]